MEKAPITGIDGQEMTVVQIRKDYHKGILFTLSNICQIE
jgi:hypothetical protein